MMRETHTYDMLVKVWTTLRDLSAQVHSGSTQGRLLGKT